MKKLLSIGIVVAMIMLCVPCAYALDPAELGSVVEVEYLPNGDYIETVLENDTIIVPGDGIQASTITRSKTKKYKNSSGTTLWYVKVTGTFSYNGTSATCTSCSHQAASYYSSWTITSASHSKSGNTATATATAVHNGSSYTRSVTLTCSPNGNVS